MNDRNAGLAEPIDGASRPAEALDAAPVTDRPKTRQEPPARATASVADDESVSHYEGVARKAVSRENLSETLAGDRAYDRSITLVLSTIGRLAACSAQFS
jgi:hypothetical protein